jgi:hypothetical protein
MHSSSRLSRVVMLLAVVVAVAEGVFILKLRQEQVALRESGGKARGGGKSEAVEKITKRDAELQVLRVQAQDMLRLRFEVRLLRAATNDLARLQAELLRLQATSTNTPEPPPTIVVAPGDGEDFLPKQGWTFAGYATPEATLQSWMWSLREGDLDAFLESLAPDGRAKFESQIQDTDKSEEDLAADLKRQSEGLTGFQILDQNAVTEDTMLLLVRMSGAESLRHRFLFTRTGNEWRMSDAGIDQ